MEAPQRWRRVAEDERKGSVMTRHTPSILAALVRAEEAARKAYEFTPGSYTYAALTAIQRALTLAGYKADASK
jgi:hypothetical protein